MAPPTRVFLTGFMGSGKSTVGPRLAEALGYAFEDLDDTIERLAGRPVTAVFAEQGEAAFRALERRALRATATRTDVVVALGGGALAEPSNLRWALDHATVVYLRLPPAALADRLRAQAGTRPMLQDALGRPLPPAALAERVASLLASRAASYEQAHHVVELDGLGVAASVEAVRRCLQEARQPGHPRGTSRNERR